MTARIRCAICIQFGDPMKATEAEQDMTTLNSYQVCTEHARMVIESGTPLDLLTLSRIRSNATRWAL